MSTQTSQTKQAPDVPGQVDRQKLYGLPVDTTISFSNHEGIYKPQIEKRQRKLLQKVSRIAPFLERTERILHITAGCSHISFLEQLLTGAVLYSLKRALFVFTDRRILHIPCSPNLCYRDSIAQILYADCRRIYMRFSTLIACYKSGRTEKFPCISRQSRKKIKAILKENKPPSKTSLDLERSHLCPQCSRPLIKNYYACPHCDLKFKTKPVATMLSIIFPGGGYFYIRHPFLGALEAIMETLFIGLLAVISWAYYMQSSNSQFVESAYKAYGEFARFGGFVGFVFGLHRLSQAVAVCAIILVFEKLVTILYANKSIEEYVPKLRQVEPKLEEVQEYHVSSKEERIDATGWRSR
ncbi:MAG: hypothetical protein JW749_08695 [Sedimentisphaerales bacterium]|nr:hypothetical protein [Sedimentisphaerales bacterium]